MKFQDIRQNYYDITARASDVARQLTFAGFAAIWIFNQSDAGIDVPVAMAPVAVLFAASLMFDVAHYAVASALWAVHVQRADAACNTDEDEYDIPTTINVWPRRLFALKLACVGLGYGVYIGALIVLGWSGQL